MLYQFHFIARNKILSNNPNIMFMWRDIVDFQNCPRLSAGSASQTGYIVAPYRIPNHRSSPPGPTKSAPRWSCVPLWRHMSAMASEITTISYMYSSLLRITTNEPCERGPHYWTLLREIHRWSMDSPHKGLVIQRMVPCHDFILGKTNTKKKQNKQQWN